jgi:branched-chain amino acid transport system substrate-binding protein
MRPTPLVHILLLLTGCSLSTVDVVDCDTNAECRDAFGLGSVCTDAGTCDVVDLDARCETVFPTDLTLPIDSATTHVIGTVFDHTLDTHVGRYQSAQLAVKQANDNGGLDTHDFAIIHCNNQDDTEDNVFDGLTKDDASVAVASFLADEIGVPAIVGPAASSRTEQVHNEVAVPNDMLVVSPSATSPNLTPLGGATPQTPDLLWRTAPPDGAQAAAISFDMLNNVDADDSDPDVFRTAPALDVGVVHQTGAYGAGLADVFRDTHTAAGGTVQTYPFENDTGRNDAIVDALAAGHDEVLFISSEVTDNQGFIQSASTNPSTVPLFLPDAARNADVLDTLINLGLPGFVDRLRGSAPASPSGNVYDGFVSAYAAEYDNANVAPLSFTAQSYDAAWLVIYGHAWAVANEDGLTGTNIARGLRRVSSGDPVDIRGSSWNAVKGAFANGGSVDVTGASGLLDFDPATDETNAAVNIWLPSVPAIGAAEFRNVDLLE